MTFEERQKAFLGDLQKCKYVFGQSCIFGKNKFNIEIMIDRDLAELVNNTISIGKLNNMDVFAIGGNFYFQKFRIHIK